jgi:hypothetical protein
MSRLLLNLAGNFFPIIMHFGYHSSRRNILSIETLFSCLLSSGSFIWNDIKSVVPLLKLGFCYSPCVSSSLDIWLSPWIPTLPNFQPIPRVSRLIMENPLAILDLINPITLNWNVSLLTFIFDSSTVTEILKIKIRALSDAFLWIGSAFGVFTTKTAHHLFTSNWPLPISPVSSVSWKGSWKKFPYNGFLDSSIFLLPYCSGYLEKFFMAYGHYCYAYL